MERNEKGPRERRRREIHSETQSNRIATDSPRTVLLSDMIRAGTEALLAADRQSTRVHQVAKELPTGGHLEQRQSERGGNAIEGLAKW